MRCLGLIIVFLMIDGCIENSRMNPQPAEYRRVAQVAQCGTPVNSAHLNAKHNVVPTSEFSARLLQLTGVTHIDSPLCWYGTSEDTLELEAGPACAITLLATFRKTGGNWVAEAVNTKPLVMCHERAQ